MKNENQKMVNDDLYAIKQVIERVKNKGQNRFKLPLIINEKMIDERIKALEELREQSDRFKEFEQKRRDLILNHAEKDESGNPIIYSLPDGKGERLTNQGYGHPNIVERPEEFDKALKALQDEYKEDIEKEVAKEKEFAETLTQPVDPELKFNKIAFDHVPEVEYDELKVLMPMIGE